MLDFKDNKGYSLIELIITIGLISIAIGLSSFGLSVIYNSNVNAIGSNIVNDIRLVQAKEMASNALDYRLVLGYDGNQYTVDIHVKESALASWPATPNVYKSYEIPKAMTLKKDDGGTYYEIDDVAHFDVDDLTFEFDVSSGKVLGGNGAGRYELSSSSSDKIVEFVVVAQNGRVYIVE